MAGPGFCVEPVDMEGGGVTYLRANCGVGTDQLGARPLRLKHSSLILHQASPAFRSVS